MHDPNTVAFTIKLPFWRTSYFGNKPWRYFYDLAIIWHVDPEKNGSDDSCGWFTPPFNKETTDIINWMAKSEVMNPWYLTKSAKYNDDPVEVERLLFGAFIVMSDALQRRGVIWRKVSIEEAARWAALLTHNSDDNLRSSLCFLSGYHSNWYRPGIPNSDKEDEFWRESEAKRFFSCIAGYILRERRFWFNKPRWHVHHWRIQIPLLDSFKRWVFSKCCKCGKGFSFGYAPTSYSWYGTGPKWFKTEENVFHHDCSNSNSSNDPVQE